MGMVQFAHAVRHARDLAGGMHDSAYNSSLSKLGLTILV